MFNKETIKEFGEYEQWKKRYVLKEFPLDVAHYNDLGFKRFIDYYTGLVKNMTSKAKITYDKAGIIRNFL